MRTEQIAEMIGVRCMESLQRYCIYSLGFSHKLWIFLRCRGFCLRRFQYNQLLFTYFWSILGKFMLSQLLVVAFSLFDQPINEFTFYVFSMI